MATRQFNLDSFSESSQHAFKESPQHARGNAGGDWTETLSHSSTTDVKTGWAARYGRPPGSYVQGYFDGTREQADLSGYQTSSDGTTRRFKQVHYVQTSTPDPATNTDSSVKERTITVDNWGNYTDTGWTITTGSGSQWNYQLPYYSSVDSSTASSTDSGSSIYAISTTNCTFQGLTGCVQLEEATWSDFESIGSCESRAMAAYSAGTALSAGGGGHNYTYNSSAALVDSSIPATLDLGGSQASGWRATYTGNYGEYDIVAYAGVKYAINAQWWYLQTDTFTVLGSLSSTAQTQQSPLYPTPPATTVAYYLEPAGGNTCVGALLGKL